MFLKTKKDAGNPVVLYYNLNKPIERDLTPSEIQAYLWSMLKYQEQMLNATIDDALYERAGNRSLIF